MVGLGVASFGQVNGVHMQNYDTWETYSEAVGGGEIPLSRAYRPTGDERMIRELVLQLKLGSVRPEYFTNKYGVDILRRVHDEVPWLEPPGVLKEARGRVVSPTPHGPPPVDGAPPPLLHPPPV